MRIAQEAGSQKAAEIYEEMLGGTLRESAAEDLWERLIFITPESDAAYFHRQGLRTWLQRGNGIGERMGNAFIDSMQVGVKKLVLVGTDIPTLSRDVLVDTFEKLTEVPAVIGPSEDGGFYLFGLSVEQLPTVVQIFHQPVPWSTETVFSELERWCRVYQLPLYYLPCKSDIDTYEDWVRYQADK